MASLIKDWRARADWETLMSVGGLPFDRFFTVIRLSASATKLPCRCRSDDLLKPARANTRRFRTPRTKFYECAGEKIALYLNGTHTELCEGLVSGLGNPAFFAIFIWHETKKMTLCCP